MNPLTQPLSYITLNGKLTLYATRGATDQLRRIYKVSVESLVPDMRNDVYFVTCKVKDGEGRTDIATGAVTLGNLKGDALANQLMKAETKAKRRATLSIVGLGLLDESELETIPAAARQPVAAPVEIAAPAPPDHDPMTGEFGPRVLTVPQTAKGDGTVITDWVAFGRQLIAMIQTASTVEEVTKWHALAAGPLGEAQKVAPKVYSSVSNAMAKALNSLSPGVPVTVDAPRLPAKESQQLRRALVKKLADCQTLAAVDAWRAASEDGIASLQDEDRAGVMEWMKTREGQLTEVAEVVAQ